MPQSTKNRRTILVVDDEKLIRWSLRERLEREGYQVREAVDGKMALTHIRQDDVDLVLLDVRLPDMDGLEILKQVKRRSPSTVVILMTAYASIQNAVEARRFRWAGWGRPTRSRRRCVFLRRTSRRILRGTCCR